MKLEIKNLKDYESLESYFDTYFNSKDVSAELIELPTNHKDFTDDLIQTAGDNYLLTCRLPRHSSLSESDMLITIYSYIWLHPIYLEVYFGLDKWWDPAIINLMGQKKVCSVWKVRTFEDSDNKSIALTIPKALPLSRIDAFNVLSIDIIKARFSAAIQELEIV